VGARASIPDSFTSEVVKGIEHALVPASAGTYVATYVPDSALPTVATSTTRRASLALPGGVVQRRARDNLIAKITAERALQRTGLESWTSSCGLDRLQTMDARSGARVRGPLRIVDLGR